MLQVRVSSVQISEKPGRNGSSSLVDQLMWSLRGGRPTAGRSVSIRYGGFFRRAGGLVIDHVILVVFNLIMLAMFVIGMTLVADDFSIRALLLHEIFGASVGAWMWTVFEPGIVSAYFLFHWRLFGATPGMWLFDIQVTSLDLSEINWRQAFLRYVGYVFSIATAGLGFFWALFDSKQQGIHDKLARTIVIRRSELEELEMLAEAEEERAQEEIEELEHEVEIQEPEVLALDVTEED